MGSSGSQATIGMHIDDLFVSSKSDADIEKFENYMRGVYTKIKVSKVKVIDYLGTTIDYMGPSQVSITMDSCEQDILAECGV